MDKKITPEYIRNNPMTGVGVLSGFGTPENPPDYNLDDKKKIKKIPKTDTHPGTGLQSLDGNVKDVEARDLLGEDD